MKTLDRRASLAPYLHEKEELASNLEAMATHLNDDSFTHDQLKTIRHKINDLWVVIERRSKS